MALRDDAGAGRGRRGRGLPHGRRAPAARSARSCSWRAATRTIAETAAPAAAAGARGARVWDEDGDAGFPAVPGDSGSADPGRRPRRPAGRGAAAPGRAAARPARHASPPDPVAAAPVGVASFSSWGPTADGRQKPDLVAPAGRPRGGLARPRRRRQRPGRAAHRHQRRRRRGRGPRAAPARRPARSSGPARGALPARPVRPPARRAWPPRARAPASPRAPRRGALRIEPAIVAAEPVRAGGARAARRAERPRGRAAAATRCGCAPAAGSAVVGEAAVGASGRAPRARCACRRRQGRLVVRDAAGDEVAAAPVLPSRPARTTPRRARRPRRCAPTRGLAEVRVRLGPAAARRRPAAQRRASTACGSCCCPWPAGRRCRSPGRSRAPRGRPAPTASWSRRRLADGPRRARRATTACGSPASGPTARRLRVESAPLPPRRVTRSGPRRAGIS